MKRTFGARKLDLKIRLIRALRRKVGHRWLWVERWDGERTYGLRGLDLSLRQLLQQKEGFYVELGANDGLSQSNTAGLEFFDGWRGVLIEPVPAQYAKLRTNRSSRRNSLVNAACVGFGFPRETIKLAEANLMSIPLEGESDIANPIQHAEFGRSIQEGYEGNLTADIIEVSAVTLTDVLISTNAPREIDFLSLDVEGGELEVLMGIRFDLFVFRWMIIECRSPEKIATFLAPHGYRLQPTLTGGLDLLFVNDGAIE